MGFKSFLLERRVERKLANFLERNAERNVERNAVSILESESERAL